MCERKFDCSRGLGRKKGKGRWNKQRIFGVRLGDGMEMNRGENGSELVEKELSDIWVRRREMR